MKTEMDKDRTARGIRGMQAAPAWFCAATARVRSCAATAATAALMLLAGACTEEPLPDRDGVPDGGGVAVTLNLTPEALSLPAAENAAANAAAADDGGAVSVRMAAPAETPATRAVSDLTVENVWILQFDGTAAGSKLILKRYVEGYVSGTAVSLLPGASQRVVVLANSYDAALCDGLRLYEATYADVQAMEGPAPDALNANPCIPMSGTATLTVAAGASFSVSLKGIVAKVIFQVKVGRGMPTAGWEIQPLDLAPAYWMPDTGSGVWPAAEKLKGGALTAKTGVTLPVSDYATYTWYLPVNRRGSVSGTTAALRRTNAPAGATCIKLSHESTVGNILSRRYYYIHLGANFTTDYNLRAHTQYSYLTTLQALAGDDSRAEVKDVDVSVLQYAGMFGGHLVEKNGVWQFTKELWVQKADQLSNKKWGRDFAHINDLEDGKGNTLAMMPDAANSPDDYYPVLNACWYLNAGPLDPATTTVDDPAYQWFCPALKQLLGILMAQNSFEAKLVGFYWSVTSFSTDSSASSNIWCADANNSGIPSYGRNSDMHNLRCVREL